MHSLTNDQRERIAVVREDLIFLRDEWDHEVSDASLRRTSPVLRRLLVEGHLGIVWRDIGFPKQPIIQAPNLARMLEGIPPALVGFAQAGGGRHRELQMSAVLELRIALTPQQAQELNRRMGNTETHKFPLTDFAKSVCIVIEGTPISRTEVVKYVSNKLGGAHFDPKRNPTDSQERKFLLLDSCRKTMQVSGTNAVLFELLSIGQSIIMSQDIANLLYASGGGPFIASQPSILD